MGAAFFYHLTDRRLEHVIVPLLEKARSAYGRVVIRGVDRAQMERLDAALWQGDGFLPHGLSGGDHDDAQPVLLTTDDGNFGAECLMTVHGASVSADEAASAKRTCVIFDGNDPGELQSARTLWKELTARKIEAEYWADDGGWVRKA